MNARAFIAAGPPPKWQQVARLARAGCGLDEIALATGSSRDTVHTLLSYARRKGEAVPRFPRAGCGPGPRVRVSDAVLAALEPHADARDISARDLATVLLTLVVEGGLVDAVLDDAGGCDV